MSQGVCRYNEIFKYIKDFKLYHMRLPSRKEIMYEAKIGHGSLTRVIKGLEKAGKIKRLSAPPIPFEVLK